MVIVDPGEAERLKKAMEKLVTTLKTAEAAKATQDKARDQMRDCLEAGEAALEAKDWAAAIEAFESGLEPELRKAVNGEKHWTSPVKDLELGLESVAEHRTAEADARTHASSCLTEAEEAMVCQEWADCVAACESGLKNAETVNDAALTGKLEALLSLSVANQQLAAGKTAMQAKKFEAAIAAFEAGLEEKTDARGDDGGLAQQLRDALQGATTAKEGQDTARMQAWEHCSEGELLLTGEIGSDTIGDAIARYTQGLALQEKSNGDEGWESCMPRLQSNLAAAEEKKQAQDQARACAQEQLAAGKKLAAEGTTAADPTALAALGHSEQAANLGTAAEKHKAAAAAFGVALEQQTHQKDLTTQLSGLQQVALADLSLAVARQHNASAEAQMAEGAAAAQEGGSEQLSPADRVKCHRRSAEAFVSAIATFKAGLDQQREQDDPAAVSEDLIAKLKSSGEKAELELARATTRKEMSEGEVNMFLGAAANSSAGALASPKERAAEYSKGREAFSAAMATFEAAQKHSTGSSELDTALAQALQSAVVEQARATARQRLSEGQGELAASEFCAAIEFYRDAMQQAVDSAELSAELEAAVAEAQEKARTLAQEKLDAGSQSFDAGKWDESIGLFETGLKDKDALGDDELVSKLERALARANGRSKHAEGTAALSAKTYEAAIAAAEAGLAEEKADDAELTAALTEVLGDATAAKTAQDEARAQAQKHCDEGDRLMAGFDGRIRWKDSIEKAIVEYKAGLELKDQVNGEAGWDSCIGPLVQKLQQAEDAKKAQDEARVYVAELLVETEQQTSAMSAKTFDTLADALGKLQSALEMETNDNDLTGQLTRALKAAKALKEAEDGARSEATAQLAASDRLMAKKMKEFNTIDDAIAGYEGALELDTHDDAQKAKISQQLRLAQMAKQTQDEARATAQAKYTEGIELFREEKFEDSIAKLRSAMEEQVNDDSVEQKVQKALKDVHIAKARAADIEAVTAQVGSTTSIFISGPPLHGEGWTATSEGSVYGTYRGTEEVRALINEEVIDRRFPFFVKADGLCLYRDLNNEHWSIDNTGSGRTANGHYGRIKMRGDSLPVEKPEEWLVLANAMGRSGMVGTELTLTLLSSDQGLRHVRCCPARTARLLRPL
eukprot:COSAG04_NODE_1282_length_7399_cov_9.510822_5_plen_1136_part_00